MPNDTPAVRISLPLAITVLTLLASIIASYVSMAAKVDAAAATIVALRDENARQHSTFADALHEQDGRAREQERLIVELRTTLLVKGVIR